MIAYSEGRFLANVTRCAERSPTTKPAWRVRRWSTNPRWAGGGMAKRGWAN